MWIQSLKQNVIWRINIFFAEEQKTQNIFIAYVIFLVSFCLVYA